MQREHRRLEVGTHCCRAWRMIWMTVSTAAPSDRVPNCGPSAKRTVRSVLPLSASSAPAGAKYLLPRADQRLIESNRGVIG